MAAITRLGLDGYGVRRAGDFSGKTPGTAGGPHPVGIITRLALDGYGVRRYAVNAFAGKAAAVAVVGSTFDGGYHRDSPAQPLRERKRKHEEVEEIPVGLPEELLELVSAAVIDPDEDWEGIMTAIMLAEDEGLLD